MKKQLYQLTAKHDCKTQWESFAKGDEVYTYNPNEYGTNDFHWQLWDEKRKFDTTTYEPDYAIAPGETLLEVCTMQGISLRELSETTSLDHAELERVANGTGPITTEIAEGLERATGIAATFWNNLEANYQKNKKRIEESS